MTQGLQKTVGYKISTETIRSYFLFVYCYQEVRRCVHEAGIGFMMSPIYHPAMKIVRPIRKKLKVKTVFNILGPMLNPARVNFAVVGVYGENLVSVLSNTCHSGK